MEIASIQDIVTQSQIGKMRIEWWKQAINDTFHGSPPNHPVALALANSLETARLSKSWFNRILNERADTMFMPAFSSIEALERYGENTNSVLIYLHLEALGIVDLKCDHAASHIGKAAAMATQLRAAPLHLSKSQLYLPTDIMNKHSIVTEDIIRKGTTKHFEEAIFELSTRANDQAITARTYQAEIPKEAVPALLNLVPAQYYLKQLERSHFDILDNRLSKKSLTLPFNIWKHARKYTY